MPIADFIPFGSSYKDLTGQRFGRLTVLNLHRKTSHGFVWESVCDCGGHAFSRTDTLKSGQVRSCGCLAREARYRQRTHGMKHTRIYKTWLAMRQRCSNPKVINYRDYGGRGIKVCERWQRFEDFFADMGHPPSPSHSIDRIDNDGNYCPDNCRWATDKEQKRNRRNTIFLTFKDQTKPLAEWADMHGISPRILGLRICHGWDIEQALTKPIRNKRLLTANGETLHITAWAEKLNLTYSIIYTRLHRGWSVDEALGFKNFKERSGRGG